MDYSAAIAAAAQAASTAPVPGRVLHIDGDYAAYNSAGTAGVPPGVSRKQLIERMDYARRTCKAGSIVLQLTSDDSTKGDRRLCATVKPYQEQRSGKTKPPNWSCLRMYCELLPNSVLSAHREADDAMAAAAYADPENTVLHYADKDMRMLPGWHLTWADHHLFYVPKGTYEIIGPDGLVYGHKWLWLQMLHGDTVDNIPGLERHPGFPRGVGPSAADTILTGCSTSAAAAWAVADAYRSGYGEQWADRFVEQLALLWLRESALAPVVDYFTAANSPLPAVWEHYGAVLAATKRLKQRVKEAHDEVKIIADRAGSDQPFEYTEW